MSKIEWSYMSTVPVLLHGVVLSLKNTGTTLPLALPPICLHGVVLI